MFVFHRKLEPVFSYLACVWIKMRFFSKCSANVCKAEKFFSKLDFFKLEKSLLLRGLDNNTNQLRQLVEKIEFDKSAINDLQCEILKLPNYVHPKVWNYGNEVKEVYRFSPSDVSECKKMEFSEVCKYFNIFRMDHLGNYTGHKSYYLLGELAELEQSLIQHAVDVLKENSFSIISVPDILPKDIITGCGMETDGDRTQVYKIDSGMCLSGTAEMAIAGFFSDKILKEEQLPLKYAAVSRCYRAETSGMNEEKGIYRVHQFTKVEMFSVCTQNQSEEMVEAFKDLEMDIFKKLNLNFRLLDMPPVELGASAYQKYDIETWMPGRELWGEISSCSNCTDYQSKRLNIKYVSNNGDLHFTHTVNGTVSAIPRLLISIIESNQVNKKAVKIPTVLQNYLKKSEIVKAKNIPEIRLVKHIKQITND